MTELHKLIIVDDEQIVREGIKNLLDWEALGYHIAGEAANSTEAFKLIKEQKPELVLLDVRMPGMYGTDFIKMAREEGCTAEFIIISGYSEFKYAQQALKYGASYYLTKPIDEDELQDAVTTIREKIEKNSHNKQSFSKYRVKAHSKIIADLMTMGIDESIDYDELSLSSPIYQVIIYENFTPYVETFDFADILKLTNDGNSFFESVKIENHNVILLKGKSAISHFERAIDHLGTEIQKGSPLDMIFFAVGEKVDSLEKIHDSYETAVRIVSRRFLCERGQHFVTADDVPDESELSEKLTQEWSDDLVKRATDYIETGSKGRLNQLYEEMRRTIFYCTENISDIKAFLSGVFMQIKANITRAYSSIDFPFAADASIISLFSSKYYLYEIIEYFQETFDMVIRAVGGTSGEGVIQEMIDYIGHNYSEPLKLESLAMLFGYNSSYLGKLFTQKIGMNFNTYLDDVRVKEARKLLETTDLKIYEISSRVGYNDVDYFHRKFKKFTGASPAEYRRKFS